jgi:hypothetical protein
VSSAVPKAFAEPGSRWVERIRRELADQRAGRGLECATCGHARADHDPAGCRAMVGPLECKCYRFRFAPELEAEAEADRPRERLPYRD